MVSFSSMAVRVMPVLRDREVLLAEIARSSTGRVSDTARASIAEIELAIKAADADAARGSHDTALRGYQRARGLVYRVLNPHFDVSQWIREHGIVSLPAGQAVETQLLAAGATLMRFLRPEASESAGIDGTVRVAAEGALSRYAAAGFRRESTDDQILESAGREAVTLLADGKPDTAVIVLRAALESGREGSPQARATTQLNLATALVQAGDARGGRKVAGQALEGFRKTEDTMGIAQSLHVQAAGAVVAGEFDAAKELFAQVDKLLESPVPTLRLTGGAVRPVPDIQRLRTSIESSRLTGTGAGLSWVLESRAGAINRVDIVPSAPSGFNGRSPEVLGPVRDHDIHTLPVRLPGQVDGWQTLPLRNAAERATASQAWRLGLSVGTDIVDLTVSVGEAPSGDTLRALVYEDRLALVGEAALRLVAVDAASTSAYLTHVYAFALLVKIGDELHEVGRHADAEASYAEAATYSFLNADTEAPALWVRLARNAAVWGDRLYLAEDFDGARAQYGKLIAEDSTVPSASLLYTTASLGGPADEARNLIAHLFDRPLPAVPWEIGQWVLHAMSYLSQIADGLDFYGLALSPIHTFEYLQGVARSFAQEAISSEREYVNFRSRQQIEAGTRRDLEATIAMAVAEARGRQEQYAATLADVTAAQAALQLAVRRRDDAISQRDDYASSSWTQIWSQAAATAQGMGSNSWFNEIKELADKLDRGESISGERGKLAAAYTFQAGRRNREYELAKMQDAIDELNAGIAVAQAQVTSAQRASRAAELAWQASLQRVSLAQAALTAFDANEFTPQAWGAMADVMRDISRDYLSRAIRIAKLMERAYNFENDSTLQVIKDVYGYAVSNANGADAVLLGGDGLMVDIESFTYVAITSTRRKQSRIKDTISMAFAYPAQFEVFRRTGVLSFETDLYEFDRLHPGFHQQRIEAVELQFVGLVPEEGLNGTLMAGGVTTFRQRDGGVGRRVHQVDTMALSDFEMRNDLFLYAGDSRVRGLFQGLGVGGTWELLLPRRSNAFDFARIVDVQLVIYYTATFDLGLRESVLTRAPRPGELSAVRDFNLRYDAPDSWYGFYRTASVDFSLDQVRFPANQLDLTTTSVQLRLQPVAGIDPGGITMSVTAPGQAAVDVTTDAGGALDLTAAVPGLIGESPLGAWHLEVTGGPSMMEDGQVRPERLVSSQVGVEYSFTYPEEA